MTVEQALEVLQAAGWEIQHHKGYGQMWGNKILMETSHDPESKYYHRAVAQQPWASDD